MVPQLKPALWEDAFCFARTSQGDVRALPPAPPWAVIDASRKVASESWLVTDGPSADGVIGCSDINRFVKKDAHAHLLRPGHGAGSTWLVS